MITLREWFAEREYSGTIKERPEMSKSTESALRSVLGRSKPTKIVFSANADKRRRIRASVDVRYSAIEFFKSSLEYSKELDEEFAEFLSAKRRRRCLLSVTNFSDSIGGHSHCKRDNRHDYSGALERDARVFIWKDSAMWHAFLYINKEASKGKIFDILSTNGVGAAKVFFKIECSKCRNRWCINSNPKNDFLNRNNDCWNLDSVSRKRFNEFDVVKERSKESGSLRVREGKAYCPSCNGALTVSHLNE